MSRGPGRIERAIEAAFAAEPDNAFTTEELCAHAYPGVNRVDKKHRVAVLRAAKQVRARNPWLDCFDDDGLGGQQVFFNRYVVMSYAMARLKCRNYRSSDGRIPSHLKKDETDLRASLGEGGKHHDYVVEGGAWWLHTQTNIAERDGDHERAAALKAENAAAVQKILEGSAAPAMKTHVGRPPTRSNM